jgi:hypothetical protein
VAPHGSERLSERRLSGDELEATDVTDGSRSADQADVSFEREIDGGFQKALTAAWGRHREFAVL